MGPSPAGVCHSTGAAGDAGSAERGRKAGLCVGQGMKSSLSTCVAAEVFPQVFVLLDNKALQQKQRGTPDSWGSGKGQKKRGGQQGQGG